MDHYFSSKPSSESHREIIAAEILGKKLSFYTDSGVFSKKKIDIGSEVLIKAMSEINFPKGNLLDMGCGYGPIGLYLATNFPEREIEMVDVNERALELAKENARLNNIENVTIYRSDSFKSIENQQFAGIISNPPIRAGKKVVHQILTASYDYLVPGGLLAIVIQKKQGAPSARKKMAAVFGHVERIALEKGYWVLVSKKQQKTA